MVPLFGDLDWPLKASRGLSAIVEFLVLFCDVVVHSLDYATAYCNVSIVPMAVCSIVKHFCPPPSVHTVDNFFFL